MRKYSILLASFLFLLVSVTAIDTHALSINTTQVQDLDYGKFVKPLAGGGRVDVFKDGTLVSDNIQLLSSSGVGAITNINLRQARGIVHISMSNDGNVPRLNFRRFAGTYQCLGVSCSLSGNFNEREGRDFSVNIPSNRRVRLRLEYGARLRVGAGVATGIQHPSYTISINHE